MAADVFDFEAFKALKPTVYKTQYCKPAVLRKATGGIFLTEYTMGNVATKCVLIPFKKYTEANKTFKQIKQSKEHPLIKVALATLEVSTENNKETLKANLQLGNLTVEKLLKKSKVLNKWIKMGLEVTTGVPVAEPTVEEKAPATTTAETATENTDTTSPTAKKTKLSPEQRAEKTKVLNDLTDFFNKLANMS